MNKSSSKKIGMMKQMLLFFKNLYEQKYHLKAPKMTTVKDGIYIYSQSGLEGPIMKIFIGKNDFLENPEFYKTYLENVDDRVIRRVEEQAKKELAGLLR